MGALRSVAVTDCCAKRLRAKASMPGERSTPATRWPRWARVAMRRPLPQAGSSTERGWGVAVGAAASEGRAWRVWHCSRKRASRSVPASKMMS